MALNRCHVGQSSVEVQFGVFAKPAAGNYHSVRPTSSTPQKCSSFTTPNGSIDESSLTLEAPLAHRSHNSTALEVGQTPCVQKAKSASFQIDSVFYPGQVGGLLTPSCARSRRRSPLGSHPSPCSHENEANPVREKAALPEKRKRDTVPLEVFFLERNKLACLSK